MQFLDQSQRDCRMLDVSLRFQPVLNACKTLSEEVSVNMDEKKNNHEK